MVIFEKLKSIIDKKYFLLGLVIFLFGLLVITSVWIIHLYMHKEKAIVNDNIAMEVTPREIVPEQFFVDIKGAVKKPGVYEVNSSMLVNDVISLAGGLKSNAYTKNINLSKKISNEMVIYIYTKSEYNKLNTTKEPVVNKEIDISNEINTGNSVIIDEKVENEKESETPTDITTNDQTITNDDIEIETKLININTATIEDFSTLSGIGESKAQKIIEYRNTNGLFNSIDELKNVSGIGESTFEKIKAYLTV